MTDRPIIFSASMVKALLEGRKSQTRRVLKLPKRTHSGGPIYERPDMGGWAATTIGGGGCFTVGRDGRRLPVPERPAIWHQTTGVVMALPFDVGDRLWVRETWKPGAWRDDGRVAIDYRASPELTNTPWVNLPADCDWDDVWLNWTEELRRAGSKPDEYGVHHWEPGKSPMRWRSPATMPIWASRLTLTVNSVRVQRLQDVTEADAMAEGATSRPSCSGFMGRDPGWSMDWSRVGELSRFAMVPPGSPAKNPLKESDISLCDPRMAVASQWNEDHGPGAWDANPWICALTFTVSRGNIDGGAA